MMNFQWGDKGIEWTDATWSPVTGCKSTPAQCAVQKHCWARKQAERMAGRFGYPLDDPFRPTFHPERLQEPYGLKKSAKVFVCSMGDLWGPWVPQRWQAAILRVVEDNPQHTFQFLTKYPQGYRDIVWSQNAWLGTTVNSNADSWRIEALRDIIAPIRFVSAEPLLSYLPWASLAGIDWLILGAQTNPSKQPRKEWVDDLLAGADAMSTSVFIKDNLDYKPKRREFPK